MKIVVNDSLKISPKCEPPNFRKYLPIDVSVGAPTIQHVIFWFGKRADKTKPQLQLSNINRIIWLKTYKKTAMS